MCIQRGNIAWVDLTPYAKKGTSVQTGVRPVVCIQNNVGNKHSPTIIVSPITSRISKAKLPTHIEISEEEGVSKPSIILLEQMITISQEDVKEIVGIITDKEKIKKLDIAAAKSIGIDIENLIQKPVADIFKINKLLKMIDSTTRKINKYGKMPYFTEVREMLILELRDYCSRHDVNYINIENRLREFEFEMDGDVLSV